MPIFLYLRFPLNNLDFSVHSELRNTIQNRLCGMSKISHFYLRKRERDGD